VPLQPLYDFLRPYLLKHLHRQSIFLNSKGKENMVGIFGKFAGFFFSTPV